MVGMKAHVKLTVLEVDRPRELVQEMTGTFPGKWTTTLEPSGQVTKAKMVVDYTVPGGRLGKVANRLLLERMNQRNLEQTLEGLKIYCEA